MGKSIIITGIDAENANLGQVELASVVDITGDVKLLVSTDNNKGCQYLHYPAGNLNDAFQLETVLKGSMVAYVDVSKYKGKRLLAYIVDTPISSTNFWKAFASAVNKTTNISSTTQNAITAVQRISGKGGSGLVKNEYVIPEDANYFVFSVTSSKYDKIYIKVIL